jgi:hypothetical protein
MTVVVGINTESEDACQKKRGESDLMLAPL